jgi:superoxide reductase
LFVGTMIALYKMHCTTTHSDDYFSYEEQFFHTIKKGNLMVQKKSLYKCDGCGVIVESLWNGDENLFCCDKEMKQLMPNTTDAAREKHVPVIERNGTTIKVKIGSIPHPMTKEHYILFIELIAGNKVLRHDFVEGDAVAEAEFQIQENVPLIAREFCNLHGLWATK